LEFEIGTEAARESAGVTDQLTLNQARWLGTHFVLASNDGFVHGQEDLMFKIPQIFAKAQEIRPKSESVSHHLPERGYWKRASLSLRIVRISPVGEEVDSNDEPVTIHQIPLLIGRRSRDYMTLGTSPAYFVEDRMPYNVSRKHCSIEWCDDQLEVIDQGSSLGTEVNGCRIGTAAGQMRAPLRMGDNEIVLGCSKRGQCFRITVCRPAD
jgi:hypothetical protein